MLKYFGFDDIFSATDNRIRPHNRDDDDFLTQEEQFEREEVAYESDTNIVQV